MPDPNALQGLLKNGLLWFAASPELQEDPEAEEGQKTKCFQKAQETAPLCEPSQESLSTPKKLLDTPALVPTAAHSDHPPKLAVGFGIPLIDQALPQGGLLFGGIHEFFAPAPTPEDPRPLIFLPCTIPTIIAANAVQNLCSNSLCPKSERLPFDKLLIWIGKECWPTPFMLEATLNSLHIDAGLTRNLLPNCIFLDPPSQKLKLWCIETTLRSPAVAVVSAAIKELPFPAARKFSLLAKQNLSLGIIIRPARTESLAGAALSRWRIKPVPSTSRHPRWEITLLSCNGAQPLCRSWLVEQRETVLKEGHYEKISLHIPALVGKRSGPPENEATERAA